LTDPQESGRGKGPAGLKPGAHLGRYRLLAPLASGGMAHVWAAKPEGKIGFSRTVALKVVRTEYSADAEYTRMLIDEAQVAGAIHHPNTCELYELDEDQGMLFMVMEWVAGDSLAGLMHRPANAEALPYPFAGIALEPLPYSVAARIVSDACAGVHAAHEARDQEGNPLNIVHRDISPPNILVSLEGQVKVSDFGIAKARYQLHARTRTGEVKGKFAYIPPEQIIGKGVTRRADVYALGCVLYVATLGLRPFGSGPSAMPKILQGDYKRPSQLLPSYPEGLEAIVVKAVSRNQDDRYATAEELRHVLEEWLTESQVVITPADVARVVRERLDEDKKRTIEALRNTNKPLLYAMAARVERELGEVTQTPTAASGLVARPSAMRPPAPSTPDDPTLLDSLTSRTKAATQAGTHTPPKQETTGPSLIIAQLRPWWGKNLPLLMLLTVLFGILVMLVLIFVRLSD
jgi:eukaryotic-like serine/threonine-protein kinase